MDFQKNKWRLLALFVLVVCFYSAWTVHKDGRNALTNQDFIRFHVIANSDSEADQELKLKVRDGLLRKINGDLVVEAVATAGANDRRAGLNLEQSRAYIQSHLDEIAAAAEEIIREEGYEYTVKAELGARFVPEKSYGSVVFPAGNYEALNVTIGAGEGHNWWCVLFPPLCLIGAEAPEEMSCDALAGELFWESLDGESLGEPGYSGSLPDQRCRELLLDPKYSRLLKSTQSGKKTVLKLEFKTLDYLKRID